MKKCTRCKVEKDLESFFSDKTRKDGKANKCRSCCSELSKEYQVLKSEEIKQQRAKYREANKAKMRIKRLLEYAKDPAKICAKTSAWAKANPEKVSMQKKIYRQKNPSKLKAKRMLEHASKLQRTPPWLSKSDLKEMATIYVKAFEISEATGVFHHVDHDIPLRGKRVSGLHVPSNLRVISAQENMSKSNRFEVA